MNTLAQPETEEECWFLQKITPEFSEEDKQEVITTFYLMAKALAVKDNDLAQEYTVVASKLKLMEPQVAQSYLSGYLQFENINTITNIKSFMYLKKLSNSFSENNKVLEKKLAKRVVLNFLHTVFYKTLPCSLGNQCKYYPRKIVHKNDFLDEELDCYFYHHEKDRRRFVLNNGEKEFKYTGNFSDGTKNKNDKSIFSQNFFESLYHPLYYKNFRCVRSKCGQSVMCPYNHSCEEKTIFSTVFKNFFGKEREIFTKKRNSEEEKNSKFFSKRSSANGSKLGRLSLLSSGSMK